jgi:hypothetical protein
MKPTTSIGVLTATLLGFFVLALPAHAGRCVRDAKIDYLECVGQCQEGYQAAKDACLNRDHRCVEACRADREDCRLATGIYARLAACNDQLAQDRMTCRQNHQNDPEGLDQCIDQAQLVAFQCRDQAREDLAPQLQACRDAFRACAKACPPPDPPTVVTDPAACKRQAKVDFKACRASCREDFQVAKDACANKDHACVEQCRADRGTCRQPFEDQLNSDIAACNSTRDAAIANCHSLYPNPDQAMLLDECIDNAQADAFECRDAAREKERPHFEDCRVAFQQCVQGCPPPPPAP